MGVSNAWGETSSTFYLAIESAKIVNNGNCSGAQFNVKYGNNNGEWKGWTTMEKTDKTYNGKVLYKTTYSFPYDGYYNWQFRIEESGNQHWYKEVYAGAWNTTLHNNQIYDYENAKWVNYTCDAEYMVYFVDKSNWGAVKAYAWNGNCDNNTDYPGVDMTKTNKTYQGYNIYSFTFNKRFANILFNGGDNSKQTSDLSCYAEAGKIYDQTNSKWIDYTYDVTIRLNGNGGKPVEQKATILYMAKQLNQEIVPPTKKGYTFDGWGNTGGNIKAIDAKGNLLPNADDGMILSYTDSQGRWIDPDGCMLYAHWLANQYLIKFDENGGTFTANGTKQIYATYKETVPNIGNGPDDIPWRRGYAFDGYTTNADGTGNRYYNENGIGQITFTLTNEVTVYAQWALETYTIAYELNGGTNHANNPNSYTYEHATITLQEPTKTGYTFNGWYDNSSFTGNTITQIRKGSYDNKTLYAKWTAKTTNVHLDHYGGKAESATSQDVVMTYDSKSISPSVNIPTREGYRLRGWYNLAENGDQILTPNGTIRTNRTVAGWVQEGGTWIRETDNETIYARWDKKCIITLNSNGGNCSIDQVIAIQRNTGIYTDYNNPTSTTITSPTRVGYTFDGWNTKADGTGEKIIEDNGDALTPNTTYTNEESKWKSTEDVTLYAKWIPDTYTITYNRLNGATHSNPATYTIEQTPLTFAAPTTTPKGYTFAGWNPATLAEGTTGNQSVTASWTAGNYTITFDHQGGTGTDNVSVTYDAAIPSVTIPTRDGYLFQGYYSEPNGNGTQYYNANGNGTRNWDTENATLYAYWVSYSNCIFFKNNLGWSNVYVYFYSSNKYWDDTKGTGSQYDKKFTNGDDANHSPHWRKFRGAMTNITGTDIWYLDYKTMAANVDATYAYEIDDCTNIVFTNDEQYEYEYFYNTKVVRRGDFSHDMQLFIPQTTQTPVTRNEDTKYYNEGVWMKYNSKESGYRLNIVGEGGTFFTTEQPGGYEFTATVHISEVEPQNLDITTLQYQKKFSNANYMTYANCTGWTMDEWNWEEASTWGITPTLVGEYTFTINLAEGKASVSAIYPTEPQANGDYRLLYVEQVVEKDINNKTIITRKKAHPSDVIKPSELAGNGKIVSLHIYKDRTYTDAIKKYNGATPSYYKSKSNPEIILQKYNGSTWTDVERHMVFGPLETLPGMAMAPGRRNTAAETATLVYDNGINAIKNDATGNGVWNFTVKASGSTATVDLSKTERYPLTTGNYYIRTANAEGGWHNYKIEANKMTYSEYATQNNEFTHYFCKWINTEEYGSKNVQFVIANDYGQAISDTIIADRATLLGVALAEGEKMVGNDGLLPAKANVRFSWKEDNNALHRAYIDGAGNSKEYLVLKDENKKLFKFSNKESNLTNDTVTFLDNGGWMYQADVYSKTNSPIKLTAKYNGKVQYFKGAAARATTNLLGGNLEDETKYPIRILYDFKENHLITGYVPQTPETKDVAIETNLMMIRKNHGAANQLTMNMAQVGEDGVVVNTGYDAYGVITFTESHLKGSDNWKVTNDKTFYWISFPFDVNLKDAFGFGRYAYHWYIEYYDGKSRADNGLFLDSGTYWEYVMEEDAHDFVLKANQGYVLWLNVAQIQADNFFTEITKEISIYFPSANKIANNFQTRSETINLPAQRRPEGSRRYTQDSNWRLIGVPSYANTAATTTQGDINFVYVYDAATNKYNVTKTINDLSGNCFQSMHAYMVQYEGDINWTTVVNEYPISQLAAKQNTDSEKDQHVLRLELQRNGDREDHTYIQLQNDGATNMFDMNLDLTKMTGSGGNIYSIIPSASDPIQAAANVMPIDECIIPLGVKTTKATSYTFAMPDGTDGIVVELIDYDTNTRTNMLLDEYTVNLGKGTFDNRFALHVQPSKVTTSVEDINTNNTGVKKYLIEGVLYMQKDGVLYDAQGKLVR